VEEGCETRNQYFKSSDHSALRLVCRNAGIPYPKRDATPSHPLQPQLSKAYRRPHHGSSTKGLVTIGAGREGDANTCRMKAYEMFGVRLQIGYLGSFYRVTRNFLSVGRRPL